ncbi:MAG: MBG domain-containing protein [Dehalococcoidia bacterium]|nr:MBG domain-containing protein [Dehalococcoidia bacterium]
MNKKLILVLVLSLLIGVGGVLVGCGGDSSDDEAIPVGGQPSTFSKPTELTMVSISQGEVLIRKANTNSWIAASAGMTLEPGDAIIAGGSSWAMVTFFEGSTIELEPGTEIGVVDLGIATGGSTKVGLSQQIGKTVSRVKKLADTNSSYEIQTPTCVGAVRGSTMLMDVAEDGSTTICNAEGAISVIVQDVETAIPVGKQITIDKDGNASEFKDCVPFSPFAEVAFTSSVNPSVYGQSVTFTATISVFSPDAGMPSGPVGFKDGEVMIATGVPVSAGQASYTTSALSAGSHSITVVYEGDDIDIDASLSLGLAQVVNKADLSATADDASRKYGEANPVFSGTVSGIQNGDSGTITDSYSSPADAASPVGAYDIVPLLVDGGSGALDNYDITLTNGTLMVEKASLMVTADDASRKYGEANPVFTGTIDGIQSGDLITASYSTSADAASQVGEYGIVPAVSDDGSGKLDNYDVALKNGTLTVEKAKVTVTLSDLSYYWDGSPKSVGVETTPPGVSYEVTYDGSPTPPVGDRNNTVSYNVVVTITDPNYELDDTAPGYNADEGSVTGILKIAPELFDYWYFMGEESDSPAYDCRPEVAGSASDNEVQPCFVIDIPNPTCEDLGFQCPDSLTINLATEEGSPTDGGTTYTRTQDDFEVTITTITEEDGTYFSFTANRWVCKVIVIDEYGKANVYANNGQPSDGNLHAPINLNPSTERPADLSVIIFCYDESTAPVPEYATAILLALGVLALGGFVWMVRRRHAGVA